MSSGRPSPIGGIPSEVARSRDLKLPSDRNAVVTLIKPQASPELKNCQLQTANGPLLTRVHRLKGFKQRNQIDYFVCRPPQSGTQRLSGGGHFDTNPAPS
jgi:hypothetical protein